MEEELTCTSCSSTWKRTKLRGRKPLLCPKCSSLESTSIKISEPQVQQSEPKVLNSEISDLSVSKVHRQLHPRSSDYLDLRESTKKGSKWQCPGCNATLVMYLPLSAVPTHRCTPNTVSVKTMQRIE